MLWYVYLDHGCGGDRKHLSCSPHNCKASPSSTHLWSYRPPSRCLQTCGFSLGVGAKVATISTPIVTTNIANMYPYPPKTPNKNVNIGVWLDETMCGNLCVRLDEIIAVLLKTKTSHSQWSKIPERVIGCSFAGSGKALRFWKRTNTFKCPQWSSMTNSWHSLSPTDSDLIHEVSRSLESRMIPLTVASFGTGEEQISNKLTCNSLWLKSSRGIFI